MQLYERSLKKACPVARVSEIKVVIPVDSVTPFKIEPSAGMVVRVDDGIELAVWDTTSGKSPAPLCSCRFLTETMTAVGLEGMEQVQVRWESETQFRHRAFLPLFCRPRTDSHPPQHSPRHLYSLQYRHGGF
jgi:hypothetical protein